MELVVTEDADGERVDRYLARAVPDVSRARLQRLIDAGEVVHNGAPAKASKRVRAGDLISLTVKPLPRADDAPKGEAIPLTLLYEDDVVAVVDKPAGMVVHPAAGARTGTLVNALLGRFGDAPGLRAGLVHRLDKGTSGALVVAKTEDALARLQAQFKARTVSKTYLALVHGVPAATGTFDTPYGRHPADRKRFTSKAGERRAVTRWKVRETFEGAALVEVALETGRTHQIRVHFAEHGHPLLGDATYGGTKREAKLAASAPPRLAAEALGRQALHAWRLAFAHPTTGEALAFEAPLPGDFSAALAILRSGA